MTRDLDPAFILAKANEIVARARAQLDAGLEVDLGGLPALAGALHEAVVRQPAEARAPLAEAVGKLVADLDAIHGDVAARRDALKQRLDAYEQASGEQAPGDETENPDGTR